MHGDYTPVGERADLRNLQFDVSTCYEVRETLDEIFGGRITLERADSTAKRELFTHLERCQDCCRSFDARLRFGSPRRGAIY